MAGIHPESDQQKDGNAVAREPQLAIQGLNAPALHAPDGIDPNQPQDMYTVLHDRVLQPTYPGEEGEPNKPPPGCPCDKETWKISYDDLVETAQKTHPEWTPHKVRVEKAAWFRPKFRSDKASIKKEHSGEQKYDSEATFTMTDDGKLVYTHGGYEGVEIEDFSLRQRRLTPEKYSPRDHQTSLAIREVFRNGEALKHKKTTIVTSYYREGADNRDILVMEYNHETKIGTIRVINTEQKGEYHDFSTITTIAKQEFPTFHETRPADGIFLLTNNAVPEEKIRQAVFSVERDTTRQTEVRAASELNAPRQIMRTDAIEEKKGPVGESTIVVEKASLLPQRYENRSVSDAIVGDTLRTADHVRKKLQQEFEVLTTRLRLNIDHEAKKKSPVLPQFLQQLLGISAEEKIRNERIQHGKPYGTGEHDTVDWQSEEYLETVQKVWETMYGARKSIAFAVTMETEEGAMPSAISAAILALDILAHPTENPFVQEATVNQSIDLQWDEKPLILDADIQNSIVDFFADDSVQLTSMQVKQESEPSILPDKIDRVVLTWIKELIQRIDEEPVEQAIKTIEHEEEVTLLQMSNVWEVCLQMTEERRFAFAGEAGTFANTNGNSDLRLVSGQDVESVEKIEREHIEDFSFATAIWFLLKLNNYYRSLLSLKTFLRKEHQEDCIFEKLKKRLPEGLVQREPTQWILLAIIWHLAMIREQGAVRATGNKRQVTSKTKIRKKPSDPYISHAGVIFAFSS